MSNNIPDDTFTPATQNRDAETRVLIMTGDGVEDLEFYYPYYRFIAAGFTVDVATADGGAFKGKNGYEVKDSLKIDSIDPLEYDLLYLPGGKAPAKLMKDEDALALTRQFVNGGKLVCAVCHGPQILAAADVIGARHISGWPEIEEEVTASGAFFTQDEVTADDQFITGRWPADLPALIEKTLSVVDADLAVIAGRDAETQARPGDGSSRA